MSNLGDALRADQLAAHAALDKAGIREPGAKLEIRIERALAQRADLLAQCKQALGAFEHNWAINWDDLARAIKRAERG